MGLRARNDEFIRLFSKWDQFVLNLRESERDDSYFRIMREAPDCFYFYLCGVKCFVQFSHDFKHGRIHYGTIDPVTSARKGTFHFDFNREGVVNHKYQLAETADAERMHVRAIDTMIELIATPAPAKRSRIGS